MPIACGGGINELSYPELLIKNGADKIVINSNLTDKKLIKKLAIKFGRQCLIGSLDFKRKKNNKYNVFVNNGRKNTNLEVIKYLNKIDLSQIGEIMINSIDNDGTGNGLDFNILKFFKKKCSIIYQGGVGNSIHFIDLLAMYTGDLKYDLDFSNLDSVIHLSKRDGFIEFTGTIQGKFSSGHTFSLSSSDGKVVNFNQIIRTDKKMIVFNENEGKVFVFDQVKDEKMIIPYEHIHQSALTHKVAKELFETGSCQLPSYEESMTLHLPLIQGFIHFLEKLKGEQVFRCPIT